MSTSSVVAALGIAALVLGCSETSPSSEEDATDEFDASERSDGQASSFDAAQFPADASSRLDGGADNDAATRADASSTQEDAASSADAGEGAGVLNECANPQSSWVFCDAFESGGTWDGRTRVPELATVPGPFDLGANHAAQLRVPPGQGGMGLYKDLTSELDVGYLRFYVLWEEGHDLTALRHGPGGFHGGNTDCVGCSGSRPSDWFTATLETVTRAPHTLQSYTYYPGMYMDCADPAGRCWGDMFPCTAGPSYCTVPEHAARGDEPEIQTGRWYCLEQMIDAGDATPSADGATGVLNFWVDEQEIGPWGRLWFRSSARTRLSAIWLYLYHHEEHSEPGILIDNVVVSRERIGCPDR